MTVIYTKSDVSVSDPGDKCTVCGEKLWPPFVEWRGHTDIFICGACCLNIKQGLMADLIQVAAIVEINRICSYFGDVTLVRENKEKAARRNAPEREKEGLRLIAEDDA